MSDEKADAADEVGEAGVEGRQMPFDVYACGILRQAHALIFTQCPEIRSVGSTLDFFGALNDANVQKGVWTSEHGPVDTADGVFGSMFQNLRLLEEQFNRAVELSAQLRDEVQELSEAAVKLREVHEKLGKEIEARQKLLGGETVAADPAVGDGVPAHSRGG